MSISNYYLFHIVLLAFGVAHHAVEEVVVKNDTLLITGCGPIGLFAVAIAKQEGATKMYVEIDSLSLISCCSTL